MDKRNRYFYVWNGRRVFEGLLTMEIDTNSTLETTPNSTLWPYYEELTDLPKCPDKPNRPELLDGWYVVRNRDNHVNRIREKRGEKTFDRKGNQRIPWERYIPIAPLGDFIDED